ncbi:hypothetical protein C2845_PM02G34380 [Panicum miliaceum]|uniref:Uncharacterized protein n=1 Tax=Panicum miliaceum TaxID=4540 RepID=A0A3L6SGH2_PANMI|nr:hypothetical protein C2845_PM02G34380 [Panicum miliaceum]
MQPAKAEGGGRGGGSGGIRGGDGERRGGVAGMARPDAMLRFGKFGGKYVPETLMHALTEAENAPAADEEFQLCNREMFDGFNFASVSEFTEKKINLLRSNGSMLLSEQKIRAVATNAKQMQKIQLAANTRPAKTMSEQNQHCLKV